MSGGRRCACGLEHAVVSQRNCNHSAFNGGRHAFSEYSAIACTQCGWVWRTKARYVERLPDGEPHATEPRWVRSIEAP